jgi:hypothetical protein
MSFNHMSVATAERHHASHVETARTHVYTTNEEEAKARIANTGTVDGANVVIELARLCDEVRKAHKQVKFAVGPRAKRSWRDGLNLLSEVWVYFPGDQYCTMRLGFAEYGVAGTSDKYGVYSRHVTNERFRSNREQHHMIMAEALPRILKAIKKCMRPYTPNDIARMTFDDIQGRLSTQRYKVSNAFDEARGQVKMHRSFFSEMRALLNLGYQFSDASFTAAVKTMVDTHEENEAKKHTAHHGYYVQVRECMGEQVFDVIPVFDIRQMPISNLGTHTTYNADGLAQFDEELPSKLAALSMLEDGAFVEGLGLKANESRFWVLK